MTDAGEDATSLLLPAKVRGDRADERIVKYRPATINLTVVPVIPGVISLLTRKADFAQARGVYSMDYRKLSRLSTW